MTGNALSIVPSRDAVGEQPDDVGGHLIGPAVSRASADHEPVNWIDRGCDYSSCRDGKKRLKAKRQEPARRPPRRSGLRRGTNPLAALTG